ncbi:Adenylate cyclase [Diplonema papillatum]|nr:Adenylate cyclase [Diplonema papillatum]
MESISIRSVRSTVKTGKAKRKKAPDAAVGSKFMSVRFLFPGASLCAVVAVVAFTMLLLIESFDNAFDRSEELCATSMISTFNTTDHLIRQQTSRLMGAIGHVLVAKMVTFIGELETASTSYLMHLKVDPELKDLPKSSFEFLVRTRATLWTLSLAYQNSGISGLVATTDDAMLAFVMSPRVRYGFIVSAASRDESIRVYMADDQLRGVRMVNRLYPLSEDQYVPLASEGRIRDGEGMWVKEKVYDASGSGMMFMSVMNDTVSGKTLSSRVFISDNLQDRVRAVTEELRNSSSRFAGIRVFGVVASAELSERFSVGEPRRDAWNATGTLSFTSEGNLTWHENGFNHYYLAEQHHDPVISAASVRIRELGGYDRIAMQSDYVDIGRGLGVHFCQVTELRARSPGFHHWLVLVLPLESLVGDVANVFDDLRAKDSVERQRYKDDAATWRYTAIFSSIVLAVLLFLAFAAGVSKLLLPLENLQVDMRSVADMQLDLQHRPLSSLHEVRSMQRSFRAMTKNLKEFKAYVPQSVLKASSCEADLPSKDPPEGDVALVFTDIQDSTSLWEKSPEDMDEALQLHNRIMRESCAKSDGYEVKTIGDAFMVAFDGPVQAVKFAFRAQKKLLEASWPAGLDLPVVTGKSGKPVFSGLRVRMGANCGPAVLEKNPITGRSDYRGGVVNMAARVESKGKAGTLCCTGRFLEAVSAALKSGDSACAGESAAYGQHELKGLGRTDLFILAPRALSDRIADEDLRPPQLVHRKSAGHETKSSGSSSRAEGAGSTAVPKKTGLYLQHVEATIACCRVQTIDEHRVFDATNQVCTPLLHY